MTRSEVARFIEEQLDGVSTPEKKGDCWHYGKCELRDLLDFIFGAQPMTDEEKLK